MGIILGYLCAICFMLLAVKAITHHCHLAKPDRFFMKIHKPLSAAMLFLCLAHLIVVIPVLQNRAMLVNISGIVMIVLVLLLIYLCHVIKDRAKRMWWHRLLTVMILIGIVIHMATYYMDFIEYQQRIENITIEDIDLSGVGDDIYEGEYDAGYIYAKVRVEMKEGKMLSVELIEHRNEHGKPAEVIIDNILEKQKIDVDAVSGATNSSKVIKKAIENAVNRKYFTR